MKSQIALVLTAAWFLAGISPVWGGVVPIPLGQAANTSFADEVSEDKQGGWTDQGPNDLRVIKPGRLAISGIDFEILSDEITGGKSCIVLGGPQRDYLPKTAEIAIESTGGEKVFYLLHAGAWCPMNHDILGLLKFTYDDGSVDEQPIRGGRDVMDWCQPKSGVNAVRCWTEYNGNTQVSMFVSKFPIKEGGKLKSVALESSGMVWMVVATAIGDRKEPEPIPMDWKVFRKFDPPALSKPLVQNQSVKPPRNIILIIGDGMGQGACDLTSLWTHGDTRRLVMQQLPIAGLCETYSLNSSVTDSAAAGTAIACGVKVNNGAIAMTPDGRKLKSVAKSAHELGKSIAIITSDPLAGATPAVFFAVQPARGQAAEIVADAAASDFEILIGNADTRGLFKQNGAEPHQRNLQKEMEERGYTFIETPEAFAAVPESGKVVGQVGSKVFKHDDAALSKLAGTAIERLSKDPDGFFMMVESTYPDKGGHSNHPDTTVMGTIHADWVAKVAVDYATEHDDTLVICTADHETGSLMATLGLASEGGPVIFYGGTNHSGVPVPIFAFGPSAELFAGIINNVDIARNIATLWGFEMPAEIDK